MRAPRRPDGHTSSANEASCTGTLSLAPGTRKVRCGTGLGASRQNVARSRKEVRDLGVLQRTHYFGETSPPSVFIFFSVCVIVCFVHVRALISFLLNIYLHFFFFLILGLERAESGRGGDVRVTLRLEGSRGCRRGRLRLWARAEHRQGVGLRDPATGE